MALQEEANDPVKKIDSRLDQLQPGTLRHETMLALRRFRASWIELGRLLNEVVYGGDYKEWGYDDFEVYCARELELRKPTFQKLMVSYNYMRKYETKRLEDFESGDAVAEVPDFQTVELLDRVRRRNEGPTEEIEELHRRAFSGEGEEPEFRRELRQHLRPAGETRKEVDPDIKEKSLILGTARKLRKAMAASHFVPDGLRERIEEPLTELEALE